MRTATAAFIAAMALPETTPATVVKVTWGAVSAFAPTDMSQAFISITPQADITTDVPAQTRLITGYSARGCSMVLAGTFTSAAGAFTGDPQQSAQWLFDPYSTTSPLHGLDWTGEQGGVVFEVFQGLANLPGQTAPEVYPVFTGYVTNVQINRTTGEVTLTLVDTRAVINTLPNIPVAIASLPGSELAPGLSSHWVMDYVLRANGVYSSPPQRPQCVWYMSGHGSLWPELSNAFNTAFGAFAAYGTFGTPPLPPTFVQGAYGSATVPAAGFVSAGLNGGAIPFQTGGNAIHVEGLVKSSASATTVISISVQFGTNDNDSAFEFAVVADASGHVRVQSGNIKRSATSKAWGPTAFSTAAAGWHTIDVNLLFTGASTATVQVWLDNVAQTAINVTGIAAWSHDVDTMQVNGAAPFETWQVTTESGPVMPISYTTTAFLDASLNPLNAIPAYTNTDGWSLIQDLCEAEFGIGGFDEGPLTAGGARTFFFKNRNNTPGSSSLTITSTLSNKDLQFETNEANRVGTLKCNVHPLSALGPQQVYTATGPILVTGFSTATFLLFTTPTAVIDLNASFIAIPIGGLSGTGNSGYMANTLPDGSGTPVTSGFFFSVFQLSATTVEVVIGNTNAFDVWLAPTSGYSTVNGVLALFGYAVVDAAAAGNGIYVTATVGNGAPAVTLPDNLWRQDIPTIQALVNSQSALQARPLPVFTNYVIVGDARLQLGDRVTVNEPGSLATSGGNIAAAPINADFIVIGIHPSIAQGGGFTQALILKALTAP